MQFEGTLSAPDSELGRETAAGYQRAAVSTSLLQWLFSFPAMLATLLAALAAITVSSRLNDPDLWWHLKLGEAIWRTHAIPRLDSYSFTVPGQAYVAHEWLAQLSIYGAWRIGGYTGLMLWLCGGAGLLLVLLYALCSLYSGNAKISLIGGLAGWFFATAGLAIRPLLIGHLFLVLELLLIHLARTRSRRWFVALPPLFALWVNCHGSYTLGLLVLGVYWCCSLFDVSVGSLVCRRWSSAHRRWLFVAGILSAGALLLNPIGIRLVAYPFNLFLKQHTNISFITEWRPLDPRDPRALALFAIAGFMFLMALIRRSEFRLEELILVALAIGMALRHQRMLFACGILVAPVLCRLISGAWESYDPRRDLRIANAIFMLAGIAVAWFVFPTRRDMESQIAKTSPVRAVDFIRRTGLAGPMLNEYEYGGYLMWALPEQKVFIDGRADIYDWAGVLGEYARWAVLEDDPNLLLKKYGIRYCLLDKAEAMVRVFPLMPGWKQVYADDLVVIFAKSPTTVSP